MAREIGIDNAKQFMFLVLAVAAAAFLLSQFQLGRTLTGLSRGTLPSTLGAA